MKIIFFGTPDFAVLSLDILNNDPGFKVLAAVTQPDKPVGRKQLLTPSPVKEYAINNNIQIFQPEKLNNDFIEKIENLNPDFLVVIAYGAILPKKLLSVPKIDSVNVHASLLPLYRGASPIQSALLNGDKVTGISVMSIDEKMDTGPVYILKKIDITEDDNYISLMKKLSQIGAIMLPSVLRDIRDQNLTILKQAEDKATYCIKIKKSDGEINPAKETAGQIMNKYRAFIEWPGIYLKFNNKSLKLLEIEIFNDSEKLPAGKFKDVNGILLLGTAKGTLKINRIQVEGKSPVSAKDFINGFL